MATYRLVDGRREYIDYCVYCGATDVPASSIRGQCERCGKRYHTYMNLRCIAEPSASEAEALRLVVNEYRALKRRGFQVPKSIV